MNSQEKNAMGSPDLEYETMPHILCMACFMDDCSGCKIKSALEGGNE